ncbi:hypothetical protein PV646_29665 [Streptomyces sp. ID05-26A]|nr:hypothetical protein [Streptomyces sp. ID05-26A]
MTVSTQRLVGELKSLCRGRGVETPGLERHIGPLLRTATTADEHDGAELSREKLRTWVNGLVHVLPDDLRLVVTTALGMNPQAQHLFLSHRLDWLADRSHRDARTVRRRLDDGFERLAEAALRPRRRPREEWYIARIRVELRLNASPPDRVEHWTVVALRDGVDEFTLPCATDMTVLKGALKEECGLRFEEPLRAGETQEFWVRAPLAAPASYALRCERFDLIVTDAPASDVPAPRGTNERSWAAAS